MIRRSRSSLGTRLLLVALAASVPAVILACFWTMNLIKVGVATVLALIIAWLGCKRFVLKPLNALVEAAREAGKDIVPLKTDSPVEIAEFKQLAGIFNEMTAAVRERSNQRRVVEKSYQRLVESLPEALFVQQTHGIVLANPTALNLLGATSKKQLADRSIMEIVHPDYHDTFQQQIAQAREGKPPSLLEGKLLRLDGSEVDVEVVVARVEYQNEPAMQFIARDITLRKRAERQLRELSVRLMKAEDEERRRIALDLHDSTAQELAAMMVDLGIIEKAVAGSDGPLRKCFTECRKLAEHCSKQIRVTSYLLHPTLLDEMGLVAALKHHKEGFTERTDINVDLDLPPDLDRLAPETELALFRVVQESLSNIQRHSGSSTAAIRLSRDGECIVLEVQDQGRGFPFALTENMQLPMERMGVGIAGMRERLRHLGGQLSISSGPHGTTVRATMPLRKRQP
jgi:PAS domain S-box-containing protein